MIIDIYYYIYFYLENILCNIEWMSLKLKLKNKIVVKKLEKFYLLYLNY